MQHVPIPNRPVVFVLYWFAQFGGMEQHVTRLCLALVKKGIEVRVVTQTPVPDDNQYARRLRRSGVAIYSPPHWITYLKDKSWLKTSVLPLYSRLLRGCFRLSILLDRLRPSGASGCTLAGDEISGSNDPFVWHTLLRLAREYRQRPRSLLHVHGFRIEMAWVLRCAGGVIPLVYTEHSTVSDWLSRENVQQRTGLRKAQVVTSVSKTSCRELKAMIGDGRAVSCVRHIVEPADTIAMADNDPRRLTVCCTSHMRPEKGVDNLLRAAALVLKCCPLTRFELASDGVCRPELVNLSRALRLGDSIVFSGAFNNDQLGAVLARADVYVLPSLTEGMPFSLIEAMAHAKAIIATRVGGVPELIEDGVNGLLVAPKDFEGLAQAVFRLIENPLERRRLGAQARRDYGKGHYDEEAVVADLLALYRRAVCDCRPSVPN